MRSPGLGAAARTVGLVAGLCLAVGAAAGRAQERPAAPDSAAPVALNPGGWAGYAVVPHPWSTVAALTVVLPVGSADDPQGAGGTAWLLGESVATAVRERFSDQALQADVQVERSRTTFRILTLEELWPEALAVMEESLFGLGFTAPGVQQAKAALESSLLFESGSPVQEFERELHWLLAGPGDPWARDPRGVLNIDRSIGPQGAPEVLLFRGEQYQKDRAVLTLTGAVDPVAASRMVSGVAAQVQDGGPVVAGQREPFGAPAWTTGDRIRLNREVTSSWIGVAYPVPPGTNPTALEMFIHRVREELVTDPPAPGLFSAEIGLIHLEDRPVFLIKAAVIPEATDEWEARILRTAHILSGEILEEEFFGWHRRRFRAEHLMEEMAPENEGLRLARDLLRNGSIRDLPREIDALEPGDMAAVAAALGPPRILILGADLAGGAL